jgi:hypothetical protein
LSYRAGRTRANNAVIRMSAEGRVAVNNIGPAVDFIIDVTGYFK